MENMELYKELADGVNELVEKSVEEYKKRRLSAWGALTPIPIQYGLPLVLGINWGGTEGSKLSGTKDDFDKEFKDYEFIRHFEIFKFTNSSNPKLLNKTLKEVLHLNFDTPNFNYSNISLLRTCDMSELQEWEIELSKDIVIKLINKINPKWIIVLGLTQEQRVSNWIKNKNIIDKILFVPHPQAHFSNKLREERWESELDKILEEINVELVA
jgi:hypothetical protein